MVPRLSLVVEEVVSLVNDPRANIARLSAVLAKDPVLQTSIIKKANSTAYGFQNRVKSVGFAISLIGFNALKETVSSVLFHTSIRRMSDAINKFEEFWNHSIMCAVVARRLAHSHNRCHPDDAMVAGLFHDIGRMVIDDMDLFRSPAARVVVESQTQPTMTHAEAGGWLAERWGLSAQIIEAIRCHHMPSAAECDPSLTATIHLAEYLCNEGYREIIPDEIHVIINSDVFTQLEIQPLDYSEELLANLLRSSREGTATGQSPDEIVNGVRTRIIDEVSRLPEQEKLVLALHYYEGLSLEQIGRVLITPELEVSILHKLAVRKLRDALCDVFTKVDNAKSNS